MRTDGRLLRKHPRLRLFDHADARVAYRRVRLPRAVDLYSFPGLAYAFQPVYLLSDFLDSDLCRTSSLFRLRLPKNDENPAGSPARQRLK